MDKLVLAVSAPFLLGFSVGYIVLLVGGGLRRGNGAVARTIVGVLILASLVMAILAAYAGNHDHGMYGGFVEFLVAWAIGIFGCGLLVPFLLSFRKRR